MRVLLLVLVLLGRCAVGSIERCPEGLQPEPIRSDRCVDYLCFKRRGD